MSGVSLFHYCFLQQTSTETGAFGVNEQFTSASFQRLPGAAHLGVHAFFKPSGFIELLLPNAFHPVRVGIPRTVEHALLFLITSRPLVPQVVPATARKQFLDVLAAPFSLPLHTLSLLSLRRDCTFCFRPFKGSTQTNSSTRPLAGCSWRCCCTTPTPTCSRTSAFCSSSIHRGLYTPAPASSSQSRTCT